MKKALAILLVLLVAGVAFGADLDPSSTLTLNSSVTGKTQHGFYSGPEAKASFGAILATSDVEGTFGNVTVTGLSMESDDPQPVGFYSFASNSNTAVIVTLTANPLVLDTMKVPYLLTATTTHGNVDAVGTSKTIDLTPASYNVGENITAHSVELLSQSAAANGTEWATYSLSVTFNGTENAAYGLPAGAYVGSVVAAITSP